MRLPRVYGVLVALLPAAAQTSSPPGNYVVTRIAPGATAAAINNFGQVVGGSGKSAFLWTPAIANATVGSLIDLGGLPSDGPHTNAATAINDRGQVAGSSNSPYPIGKGFLWSPDTPNATSGAVTPFDGTGGHPDFSPWSINAYGQMAGSPGIGGALWTPSVPNGTTGTLNTSSSLQVLQAINDLGQGVIQFSNIDSALFTPSTPHGNDGTVTNVAGPPGTVYQFGFAINAGGTVLGNVCFDVSFTCHRQGFLWTPATPNGVIGTAATLPLPPGFTDMFPAALDASGQVTGNLARADGTTDPFLYSGGQVYDLSALRSGSAVAINDRGQIVINSSGDVYLLTPSSPTTPLPGEVAITIASNVAGSVFTVTGSGCRPGAYATPQTLGWLAGSVCTVAFLSPQSSQIGTRYLFNGWQDGVAVNPRTFAAQSQATYTGNFTTQYFVTALVNVPGTGTVSGGGWYYAGAQATLTPTAASGYRGVGWSPPAATLLPPGILVTPGLFPIAVTINAPLTVTADFTPQTAAPPGHYFVTLAATGAAAATWKPINNYGQVVGIRPPSVVTPAAFLWQPIYAGVTDGTLGNLYDLPMSRVEAINDYGQVVGAAASGTSLWSPAQPNGTSGTLTNFLETDYTYGNDSLAINNLGQITGDLGANYPSSFLWTPSAPNGTTGKYTLNNWLPNAAINDYGQYAGGTTLFTPSAPNGSTGTFTQVSGIGNLIAINNAGVVLGNHGYVWTPSSPNGNVGTATQLLPPPGFASLQPSALNSPGHVVGTLDWDTGSVVPFLYRDGTFYDLSRLSDNLIGGIPGGINDRGQVVITTGGLPYSSASSVYVVSPSESYPSSLLPVTGSGSSQDFRFFFQDDYSTGNMGVLNILINSSLDGRNACYLAYDQQAGKLYLVSDDGTVLLPGLTNSQCSAASYSASPNGGFLTLDVNLSFTPTFAGNKIVYMAARNVAGDGYGWRTMGLWNVPGSPATPVAAAGVSPNAGSGASQTFTFTFTDTQGVQDLGVVDILINQSLDGRQACYLAYSQPLGTLYLVNDAGTALLPGMALNGSGSLANSQCAVSGAGSSVTASGNTLALTLPIAFLPGWRGLSLIYLAARDWMEANSSGWQALGMWSH